MFTFQIYLAHATWVVVHNLIMIFKYEMKILCVQYLRGIEFWPFPLTLHTLCCTIAYCSLDINEVCRQVT